MANISALVPSCLSGFRSLNDSLTAVVPDSDRGGDDIPEDLRPSIKNELGRFRVWVANLGAHRTGKSSLDYRLRDASNIRTQVINLLNDLLECLQDGASIAIGTVEPWDDMEPASDDEDSDSDGSEAQAPSGLTELSQIISESSEIINCLFRLSVSIHNPAPHDRFRRSAMTDTSAYVAFDTAHIRHKFPSANQVIVEQLGKANSFRRQFFRYREEHHRKLAQGLPNEDKEKAGSDDTKTIGVTTVASSLPQHLKTSNTDGSAFEDCDSRSEAALTETSFAPSSAPDGRRSRVPSMPEEAENGPFECPFCYRMISVETTKEWRKHVLGDLRPYICLYPDCSAAGQDFQRRHQWIQHVQEAHWKILLCPLGCRDLRLDNIPALNDHIATLHKEHAESLSPESLIQLSEQDRPLDASKQCELCDEELDSFKAYARHVGRHQEDVALFVLPDRGLEEDSLSDDQDENSSKVVEPGDDNEQHQFEDLPDQSFSWIGDLPDQSFSWIEDLAEGLSPYFGEAALETLGTQPPAMFSTSTVHLSVNPHMRPLVPARPPRRASQYADEEQHDDETQEEPPSTEELTANTTSYEDGANPKSEASDETKYMLPLRSITNVDMLGSDYRESVKRVLQGYSSYRNQGSPMLPQGPDGQNINQFYNQEMGGGNGMRAEPGNGQNGSSDNLWALPKLPDDV